MSFNGFTHSPEGRAKPSAAQKGGQLSARTPGAINRPLRARSGAVLSGAMGFDAHQFDRAR